MLNRSLHFTYSKLPDAYIEETREQPIILNLYIKLSFSSSNPYFYSSPTKNITNKFTIIRDLCQFFELGLISYKRFGSYFPMTGSAKLAKKLLKNPSLRIPVLTTALLEK